MTAVIDTTETADPAKVALVAELAAGLRALADMVEANPAIDPGYLYDGYSVNAWYAGSAEDLAAIARAALRAGAKVEKVISGNNYDLRISWGRFVAKALGSRDNVCTRVQVGEETVTRTVKDPEALASVPEVEVTETVPKYEWKCEPLMGHGTEAGA